VQIVEPCYLVNHQGQEYTVKLSASTLKNAAGKIMGLVFTFNDITTIVQISRKIVFEKIGFINRISDWLLDTVCAQLTAWRQQLPVRLFFQTAVTVRSVHPASARTAIQENAP
jgi:hypothetical protein